MPCASEANLARHIRPRVVGYPNDLAEIRLQNICLIINKEVPGFLGKHRTLYSVHCTDWYEVQHLS